MVRNKINVLFVSSEMKNTWKLLFYPISTKDLNLYDEKSEFNFKVILLTPPIIDPTKPEQTKIKPMKPIFSFSSFSILILNR